MATIFCPCPLQPVCLHPFASPTTAFMMPFSRVASSPSAILISTLPSEPCTGSYVVTTYNTPLNSSKLGHMDVRNFEPDYTEPSQADCDEIANDNSNRTLARLKVPTLEAVCTTPPLSLYIYKYIFWGQTTWTWDHLHKVCYGSFSSSKAVAKAILTSISRVDGGLTSEGRRA